MDSRDPRLWLEQARHDEDSAKLIRAHDGHADVGIYLLHQAAEKLLKALMLKKDCAVIRTHLLDSLYTNLIHSCPGLESIARELVGLDAYLPRLRYPSGDFLTMQDFDLCLGWFDTIKVVVTTNFEDDLPADSSPDTPRTTPRSSS